LLIVVCRRRPCRHPLGRGRRHPRRHRCPHPLQRHRHPHHRDPRHHSHRSAQPHRRLRRRRQERRRSWSRPRRPRPGRLLDERKKVIKIEKDPPPGCFSCVCRGREESGRPMDK
ncbi:hypothetical protein CTA2_9033, partial [Colletotrichum tanaceti]